MALPSTIIISRLVGLYHNGQILISPDQNVHEAAGTIVHEYLHALAESLLEKANASLPLGFEEAEVAMAEEQIMSALRARYNITPKRNWVKQLQKERRRNVKT